MLYFGDNIYLYVSFNTTYYWEYLFVIMVKNAEIEYFSYIGVYYQVTKISSDRPTEPEISTTGAEFEVSGSVQFHFLMSEVIWKVENH